MLPAETLLVDGIVAPLMPTDGSKLGYFLFDLAYLDGHDLTRVAARAAQGAARGAGPAAPARARSATSSTSRATAPTFTARPAGWGSRRWCRARRRLALRRARGLGDGRVQARQGRQDGEGSRGEGPRNPPRRSGSDPRTPPRAARQRPPDARRSACCGPTSGRLHQGRPGRATTRRSRDFALPQRHRPAAVAVSLPGGDARQTRRRRPPASS